MNKKKLYLLMSFLMLIVSMQAQLIITIEDEDVIPLNQVCIDFSVENFTDLATMQFSMSWSPSVLQYDSVTNINIPGQENLLFGEVFVDIGQLSVIWNVNPSTLDGTLPDGTVMFSLCFTVVGMENTMSNISIQNLPVAIEVLGQNGEFLNIESNIGQIMVGEAMSISDTLITTANCFGPSNGGIDITPIGGQVPYTYSWTGPVGFSAETEDLVDVFAGTYQVVVQDASTPPFMTSATIEIPGDFEIPDIVVAEGENITCKDSIVELNGTGSSVGADFEYLWAPVSGIVLTGSTSLIATVDEPGTYELIVSNIRNGCGNIAPVIIGEDIDEPFASAGNGGVLDCENTRLTLDGQGSTGDDFIFEWSTDVGNILMDENTLTPTVDEAGMYELVVTDTTNGCQANSITEITQNGEAPNADAGSDTLINCLNTTIQLDGSLSDTDDTFNYEWTSNEGNDIIDANTLTPTIAAAGIYQLVVSNTTNNCNDTSFVNVSIDTIKPTVSAGMDMQLDCGNTTVEIVAGMGTDMGDEFLLTWSPQEGIIENPNSLNPTINLPGVYELIILNENNGCVGADSVIVELDTLKPIANAGEDIILDCSGNDISLDGTTSFEGDEFNYSWTSLDGEIIGDVTTLVPLVSGIGEYVLTSLNTNNSCTNTDTVFVFESMNIPIADAGEDQELGCLSTSVILDGSASTGDNLIFQWTSENGNIISGETTSMPTVDIASTYVLVIEDSLSNCKDTATVVVRSNDNLVAPDAGADINVCLDSIEIMGNLPMGMTGQWTTNTTAIIDNPSSPTTAVSNLISGNNLFIWSLFSDDCLTSESDTVIVTLESLPVANDDIFDIPFDNDFTTVLDLTLNDGVAIVNSWEVSLLNMPSSGTLDIGTIGASEDGQIDYTRDANFGGAVFFDYILCNTSCPELCDTANVLLNVAEPGRLDSLVDVANTITPNGDGINDQFVINELADNPELFPNNEFVVINRWGDEVFKANPYNNDWEGTNQSGQELPQGTYYYILRLDISKALIYKGDITIIR